MRLLNEVRRKSFHLLGMIVPVGYYYMPDRVGRRVLLVLTILALVVEVIRLHVPKARTLFYFFFGKIVREHERFNLLGSTYVLLTALLCAWAFVRPIAIISMVFLVVGDAFAAIIGRSMGRHRIFGKTVEGSFACFVACVLTAWAYPGDPFTWRMILGGALAATIFELVPIPLDDNLRISLSAGFTMTLLR